MGLNEKTQTSVHRRTLSVDPTAREDKLEMEKPYLDSSRTSTDSVHKDETLLESQPIIPETPPTPLEYSVPFHKKLLYLALYFVLNLSLTLTNKGILQQVGFGWTDLRLCTCISDLKTGQDAMAIDSHARSRNLDWVLDTSGYRSSQAV